MLRAVAPDLWVTERPQRFFGIEIGARMTIIRLADGSLFIHSPVRLDPDLQRDLDQIGTPRYVVAPNRLHHLYIGDYPKAYPTAKIYAAPGLPEKRADLKFEDVMESGTSYPWSAEIDHLLCLGMPALNEVVFLHKKSLTLILTDLALYLDSDSTFAARMFARLAGMYGRLGWGWLDRLLWLRDKSAASDSFRQILGWEFDRAIIAHGKIVERDAKNAVGRALRV